MGFIYGMGNEYKDWATFKVKPGQQERALLLLRRREALLLYIPAVLVAYSRVALGVHTLPDVAAGSAIGLLSAIVIWKLQPRLGILSTPTEGRKK